MTYLTYIIIVALAVQTVRAWFWRRRSKADVGLALIQDHEAIRRELYARDHEQFLRQSQQSHDINRNYGSYKLTEATREALRRLNDEEWPEEIG